MELTSYLHNQVDRHARNRGWELFIGGRVQIDNGDPMWVDATVSESEDYEVSLERDGRAVMAECSCSSARRSMTCSHIWATLLAAQSKGHLKGTRGQAPGLLIVSNHDDAEWDEYDFDDESRPRSSTYFALDSRNAPRPQARRAASDWKNTLADLRSAMERDATPHSAALSAAQEIVYIVDVDTTLAGRGLSFEVATRQRKQDGDWSKPKSQRFATTEIAALPDPADRQALAMLSGGREQATPYYGSSAYADSAPSRMHLGAALSDAVVPVVCATGRCWIRTGGDDGTLRPLQWDGGEPWEFWLKVAAAEAGKHYAITGALRRGDERLALAAPHLLVAGGLVFWDDRVARFRDFGAFDWIALLRREREVRVPARQKEKLLEQLLSLPRQPRLDLPEDLRYEETRPRPRPFVKIKRPAAPSWKPLDQVWLEGELSFECDGEIVPATRPGPHVYLPAQRRLLVRDADAERAASARLEQAGFHAKQNYGRERTLELAPRNLPKAVRALIQEGWRVEAEGKLYRQAGQFQIEVATEIDWFELRGGASFGDQHVPLPTLLAALRRGENLIALGDGSIGLLPEDWLKRYGLLGALGSAENGQLRFNRSQVGLLDVLLSERPEATFDQQFQYARQQLKQFQGVAPVDAPVGFRGALRGYQREGVGWLHFLREFQFGGCLADDMGLGKTVQVLALLEARRELRANRRKRTRPAPSLVVAPRSVVFNWKQEAERFTPKLRLLDHTGIARAKPGAHFDEYDLVLTTYGTLRRDIAELEDYRFDYAILDEAQAIKNASSQSAKAARLIRADHRLAMSGTPVENHLGELWSLFEFLNPGMLGTSGVLRMNEGGLRNPDEQSRTVLAKALRPFLLRRTKEQVAKDLPARTEQTIYCDLEPAQRKLYDELRAHYRQSLLPRIERNGIKRSKIQILEALLRLRQAACHPALIDKTSTAPSAKLDALLPQLQEVFDEGHKTLVFSQFTSLLAIVRRRLDEDKITYEYLDGRTRDRGARVERFQNDPACKLFLISLKAGGLGLNLTAADYVFLLDPWWNPAVEAQAIDRAHRIGQTLPVFAYRLIARDTVEEKVLKLQAQKRSLADAIITADNSVIRDLGREDLELLLS